MSENDDYEAPPAHGSADQPLDHIGDPVQDPVLSGALRPDAAADTVAQPAGPEGEA